MVRWCSTRPREVGSLKILELDAAIVLELRTNGALFCAGEEGGLAEEDATAAIEERVAW